MKKGLIVIFVAIVLVMISWFIYPRYKLYRFLEEYNDIDTFRELSQMTAEDFIIYLHAYQEFPETSEDSIFRSLFYKTFGSIPEIYNYGVFVYHDTLTINGSVENVDKIYLKGPNHDGKHIGQTINSIDYSEESINPVNMSFLHFLFVKGDILITIIPEFNLCNSIYFRSNISYKERLSVSDSVVHDSFKRTIYPLYKQKYGEFPYRIRDLYKDVAYIYYKAILYPDTLILTHKCEPYNGEYDTSSMTTLINKPLYAWAKEIGLHQFYFSIEVRPSFFEKKE